MSRVWLAIVIVGLMVVLAVTIIIRALHAVHTGETSPEIYQAYPRLSARNDLRLEKPTFQGFPKALGLNVMRRSQKENYGELRRSRWADRQFTENATFKEIHFLSDRRVWKCIAYSRRSKLRCSQTARSSPKS